MFPYAAISAVLNIWTHFYAATRTLTLSRVKSRVSRFCSVSQKKAFAEGNPFAMTTLHLMVGLPCAGKTTLAKQLEHEYSALRLTPDEWHIPLFGYDLEEDEHNARHDLIESMLWDIAARVLVLGVNVILDFGFWAKSEREDYRDRAAQLGAGSQIHFLNVPEAVLLERLATRNIHLPQGSAYIPEKNLKEWITFFQPPTPDEIARRE